MDITSFIQKIESEIDGLKPGTLMPETNYKNAPQWSSMHALILIAHIDIEYGVALNGEDLRNCTTMLDIFNVVQSKLK